MIIRSGGEADIAAISALHTASWRSAYDEILPAWYLDGPLPGDHLDRWQQRLADASSPGLFIAEADSVLVGFVYLQLAEDRRVIIDNLHAAPLHRGVGVGTRLIEAGLLWAATAYPGRSVYLEVFRENTAAIAFYERRGGRRTASGITRFEAGFEVPVYEYTWSSVGPA